MPDNIIDKLKSCLTQIGRNDLLQDLPDYKASAGASRRSVQDVRQDSEHAAQRPILVEKHLLVLMERKPQLKIHFTVLLAKANQGIDVEKASDMDLLNLSCCICFRLIATNGTGFRVGDRCIMTAAHVLKEALGIPQEEMQRIWDADPAEQLQRFKWCVQKFRFN
ncbi:uncharacterized protein LOC124279974 isoform X2 [Haliotis rubra]|uniref:uncharacterized protein LOC124279974 isoform X2 n=1 Tax=Haliotis rubra TaxID=36100 RepID=UPI001EE608DC|nr:uncharacterized protein LOC124279974 isoform X2 [Haliotis rubra]